MKKLLLVIIAFATAQFAVGQINYFTDFNDSIPGDWTIIDADANDTTWQHDDVDNRGVGNSPAAFLDTYNGDASDDAPADDWLVSPQITVNDGDELTFYFRGGYMESDGSTFPDSLTIMATKNATPNESDFNILLGGVVMEGSEDGLGKLKRDTLVLTDNANITAGDKIYIGLYCESNGSSVYVDNFKVAQPNTPIMIDAYASDASTITMKFDDEVPNPQVSDFKLLDSAGNSFSSMGLMDAENKMYSVNTSAPLQGDLSLDTIVYVNTPDTMMIYGGITPIKYTNLVSPETVSKKYKATYTGTVFAAKGNAYWIASDTGAYNSLRINGTDSALNVGDSVIVNGRLSPYNGLTETYPTHVSQVVAEGKTPFQAVELDGSEIDTSVAGDQLPGEKYENVLAEIKNVTIEKWDGSYYFIGSSGDAKFRIGDDLGFFNPYESSLLQITSVYNIKGIVHSQYGMFQLNPRDSADITLVKDNSAPEVIYFGTSVANVAGEAVKLKSNEGTGAVYLINENADQSTVEEMDAAVSNNMGAKTAITAADTYVDVSTEGLVTGIYYGYAVDSAGNISAKGQFPVEVVPAVTAAEQTVLVGDPAIVQSSSATGKVYIVLNELSISEPADLESAVTDGKAKSAAVTAANTDIEINTEGLDRGIYLAYAVDENDLMSDASENQITVETSTGIEDIAGAKISLYPNPVVNVLNIDADVDINRVIIFNALGQQVESVDMNNKMNMKINTSGLEKGVYFISFENEQGIIKTEKFVKSVD